MKNTSEKKKKKKRLSNSDPDWKRHHALTVYPVILLFSLSSSRHFPLEQSHHEMTLDVKQKVCFQPSCLVKAVHKIS